MELALSVLRGCGLILACPFALLALAAVESTVPERVHNSRIFKILVGLLLVGLCASFYASLFFLVRFSEGSPLLLVGCSFSVSIGSVMIFSAVLRNVGRPRVDSSGGASAKRPSKALALSLLVYFIASIFQIGGLCGAVYWTILGYTSQHTILNDATRMSIYSQVGQQFTDNLESKIAAELAGDKTLHDTTDPWAEQAERYSVPTFQIYAITSEGLRKGWPPLWFEDSMRLSIERAVLLELQRRLAPQETP